MKKRRFIHKVFQKLGIWQSWRPKFSTGACTGAEAGPIRNRVDASGWKIWDAKAAKNQFLKHLVYITTCILICALSCVQAEESASVEWTETSAMLQPSPVGGIGIFATHDIPKGMRVFTGQFSPRRAKIKDIPEAFLKYCVFLNDEECNCPERFDRMEIGWFINHSFEPNLVKIAEKYWVAARDIKMGEEFFMDYNELGEPEHLKEPYYIKKD